MQEFLNNAILDPLQNLLNQIYTFLPNFFAMLLIVVIGFVTSFIIKRLLIFTLKLLKFDRFSSRTGFSNVLSRSGIRRKPVEVIGKLFYWVLLIVFLMLALNALKVEALNSLISQFFLFIPNVIAGLILFFLGYLVSILLERTALVACVNAGFQLAKFISRGVQILVLFFFLAIALEQIGIGESIVIASFTTIFGGIVLALALALGLGGRELGKEWLEKQFGKIEKSSEEEKDVRSHL
jgi:hypothetical protein